MARQNHLWAVFFFTCSDTGHVNSHFAVVLVQDWDRGKPAAFDVTVTSVLSSATIKEASAAVGAAAFVQPRLGSLLLMMPSARIGMGLYSTCQKKHMVTRVKRHSVHSPDWFLCLP